MVSFDQFRAEWEGHRVGDDSLVASHEETNDTKYQCVSLIKQYVRECYQLEPGAWGNAIQWWTATNPALFSKFTRDASGTVQKGDIVILRTVGHADFSGFGHIGIATGNGDPNSIEILEQNGVGSGTGLGSDAVRTRFVPRNRLAGVLRPIVIAQPVRTPKDYMQYSAVPNKTMRVNKLQTNWWNLSNDSDNIDNFQVASTLTVNTPFPIGGYAKNLHFPMYTYAMSPEDFNRAVNGDYSTNNGINLNDLEDIPYTPPAAPLEVPKVNYYELKTTVAYFGSATDAQKDVNARGTLDKGQYVLLKTDSTARQITKNNADTTSYWINDFDNKVPEVITVAPVVDQPTLPVDAPKPVIELVNDTSVTAAQPVVPTKPVIPKQPLQWGWINENHQPSIFQNVSRNDIVVTDLEGSNPPLKLPAGAKKICSRYTVINEVSYVLPDKEFAKGLGYGIQETPAIMEIRKPTILTEVFSDIVNFGGYLETGFKSASRLITDVSPVKISHASQRTKQMIDGFNSKRKVK